MKDEKILAKMKNLHGILFTGGAAKFFIENKEKQMVPSPYLFKIKLII